MYSYTHIYISIHIYTYIHICIPHTLSCMAAQCHAGFATTLQPHTNPKHTRKHSAHTLHIAHNSTHDLYTLHIAKHTLHIIHAY